MGKAAAKKVAGTAARAGEKAATVANDVPRGGTQKLDTQDGKDGGRSTRRPSLRLKYLGRTPGKARRTGKDVIERMRKEGKVRENGTTGVTDFQASDGKWSEISRADMAHTHDAVTWWNNTGRQYGAQTTEFRRWVFDSDKCYLNMNSINWSQYLEIQKNTYRH